jgi:trk system potassium uptake protein TrkH
MNYKMVFRSIGRILIVESVLMLPSAVIALVKNEQSWIAFLIAIFITFLAGFLLSFKKPKNTVIYAKDGFVIVALAWIAVSVFGSLPFMISGEIPHFIDALFETVSGFTTTGSSIVANVEAMPYGLLFWRSFTHWVGGMGVLVFVLALIPLVGDTSMHIMRAETPGPSAEKLVPKMKHTSLILYGIYAALTLAEVILLILGGMPVFDSVVNSFATAGTGGFAIKTASIAAYNSPYIETVIGIFMLLFGTNFSIFYMIILRKFAPAFRNEEFRWYIIIVALSTLFISVNIASMYSSYAESLRHSFFQVSSIITTTGFATVDFNLWPEFSKTILMILLITGACANSTAGGIKISRLIIMVKSAKREITRTLNKRSVSVVKLDKKAVPEPVVSNAGIYMIIYIMIMLMSLLIVSFDNLGFETSLPAVLSCLSNVGPGLGAAGPTGNFIAFSSLSKIVFMLDMLLGRLEIFPMLMLFNPSLWRRK